jgi:hypothetical protein
MIDTHFTPKIRVAVIYSVAFPEEDLAPYATRHRLPDSPPVAQQNIHHKHLLFQTCRQILGYHPSSVQEISILWEQLSPIFTVSPIEHPEDYPKFQQIDATFV